MLADRDTPIEQLTRIRRAGAPGKGKGKGPADTARMGCARVPGPPGQFLTEHAAVDERQRLLHVRRKREDALRAGAAALGPPGTPSTRPPPVETGGGSAFA